MRFADSFLAFVEKIVIFVVLFTLVYYYGICKQYARDAGIPAPAGDQ